MWVYAQCVAQMCGATGTTGTGTGTGTTGVSVTEGEPEPEPDLEMDELFRLKLMRDIVLD